jgi:hypothetical protein
MDAARAFDSQFNDGARDRLDCAQDFLTDAKKRLADAKAVARKAHQWALGVQIEMQELRRRPA